MAAGLYSPRLLVSPWRQPLAVVTALLLHALLVGALLQGWHARRDAPAPRRAMTVQLLRVEPPPVVIPSARAEERAPTKLRRRADEHRGAAPAPRLVPQEPAPSLAAEPVAPASMEPNAALSEKLPAIDPESITRAARAVAHSTSLARESDRRIDRPAVPTAQERLAAGVARGARKDCLKGNMDANGGYEPRLGGLFEIPFLAYDAVTGKCRR